MKSVNPYLKNAPRDRLVSDVAEAIGVSRFEGIGIYTALVVRAAEANDDFRFSAQGGEPLSAPAIAEHIAQADEEQKQVQRYLEEGVEHGLFVEQSGYFRLPRASAASRRGRA